MEVSEENNQKEITIEKLRFLDSSSIHYSYIIMFVIGGIILIFGIIYSQIDLASENALDVTYPISIIEHLLRLIIFFGVILFLTFNFVKISKWLEWKKPVLIANNITKILALFSSSGLFLMNVIYFIYYEVNYFKYIIKISEWWGVELWIDIVRGPLHYMDIVKMIFIFILLASLILSTILNIIYRRDIKRANYRPMILAGVIAIVYTFMFYGTWISFRFDHIGKWNLGLLVYRLVLSALYFINGTIFLSLELYQKRIKKRVNNTV